MSAVGCPAVSTLLARSPVHISLPRNATSSPHPYSTHFQAQNLCRSAQAAERPSSQKWRAMADGGAPAPAAAPPAEIPSKVEGPKPTMAKGNIVSVVKEKYLASVEYKAVDHPVYFKGLDYIYEARGEVLDVRFFEAGEYCLIAWAGIPTAPAWLPAYMLVKLLRNLMRDFGARGVQETVLKYTRT